MKLPSRPSLGTFPKELLQETMSEANVADEGKAQKLIQAG